MRDIACIADTFSIKGLDPQQLESISRIRDTAHYCLGDEIGAAAGIPTTFQIEREKILERKGSIMSNTSGKRKWKDDMACFYATGRDSQSHFSGATIEDDQVQLYHYDGDFDHLQTEPGKRVRKKERVRRKPNGKSKKDNSTRCLATSKEDQFQFSSAPGKNDQVQLCSDEFDQLQLQHLDSPISDSQLYLTDGEDANTRQCHCDSKVDQSQPCQAACEGDTFQLAANRVSEDVNLQQFCAYTKDDVSEPCQAAGKGTNSQQYPTDIRDVQSQLC